MMTTLFAGCSSSTEKLDRAEENVTEAKENLVQANQNYLTDMEDFKKNTATQIAANEQSIVEFKARIADQKKEAKADYEKEINDLDQKNTDMRKKLDDFQTDTESGWESFKDEFSSDMSDLGDAFKNFTEKNNK
ncbi:MAG: hypothetical protein NWR73_02735 [Flavobacteriales bacterium]|nr:hypothetical protein [Flavobacteriales bacterium]